MHSVRLTQTFLSDAKRAGLDDDGILEIATNISREPHQGDVILGTGGARKRRLSGKGKGKSGGFRVISYFASDDVPIILLALIDKGERADISTSDRIAIKDLLGRFADEYRRGVIRGIHGRPRIETE